MEEAPSQEYREAESLSQLGLFVLGLFSFGLFLSVNSGFCSLSVRD